MKFVLIFGDSAVGKMTVGQELSKITSLRLFHNHMTIELVLDVFGRYDVPTIMRLREVVFEEFAKSDLYGLIFTFMWAFDVKKDWEIVQEMCDIFLKEQAEIYFIELVAPLETRLERNITENRLFHKPSKRNINLSNERVIRDSTRFRLVSFDGEIPYQNYIKIDNTNLTAEAVALMIQKQFNL